MRRLTVPILMLLLAAPVAADERVAAEDFSRADALLFGPDNLTASARRDDPSAPFPFDHVLDVAPGARLSTEGLAAGAVGRGSLEDVTWMDLRAVEENALGRWGEFTVLRYDNGGPELRLVRETARPQASLQWFDGISWNTTGAVLPLDRSYRLRAVMDLDVGTMDLFVREEKKGSGTFCAQAPSGPTGKRRLTPFSPRETAAVIGASFRPFVPGVMKRSFALGRPTGMRVTLAAWQLWRVARSEVVPADDAARRAGEPVPLRYAADVAFEGDALRRVGHAGGVSWTLAAASGLRDDFELPDVSRWSPAARVQRQTSVHASGKWSLGLSEGATPVDVEVRLPPADFDLCLRFLVPAEIKANRQIYLVRFKNADTGAEPIGPGLYLDYGAAAGGKSLIIAQVRPDYYLSQEVDVKPGVWYALTLSTRRALGGYTAAFVDEAGQSTPLNGGQDLPFFLGTPTGERVLWRFFSLLAMRPNLADWPKVELRMVERRIPVTFSSGQRERLKGVTLRGIRRDKTVDIDWNRKQLFYHLVNQSEIIDRNWPEFRVGPEHAERLKDYQALLIDGGVFLPWGDVDVACGSNGTTRLLAGVTTEYEPGEPAGPGEFRVWRQTGERPRPLGRGLTTLALLYLPPASGELRAELRWMHQGQAVPIPPELFTGRDVVLGHPGASIKASGMALVDGNFYVPTAESSLEVYDRSLTRTAVRGLFFEPQISRYYSVSAFTWDPWSQCFYAASVGQKAMLKYDRSLAFKEQIYYPTIEPAALAAGPDTVYIVTRAGEVIRTDKFFGVTKGMPVETMFGGNPLFSAAACTERYLYLATRADSPILPLQVICVDTNGWHPIFNLDLKDKFPEVAAMATDGETMALLSRAEARVATFALPPKHELDPQQTFVCLDDLALTPRRSTDDVPLLPGPKGDAEGWPPPPALSRKSDGEGWLVRTEGPAPSLERRDLLTLAPGSTKETFLRLRLADPSGPCFLRVDLQVRDGASRRILILYGNAAEEGERNVGAWGRTYSLEEFFRRGEFAAWRNRHPYWSHDLARDVDARRLVAFRPVLIGEGVREHVFSLEKDFGLKPGDAVDGIILSCWRECPPILSMTASPTEWVERTESAGAVTSQAASLEGGAGRLEFVSWQEAPFDPSRGALRVLVRTADEKYFLDREGWTPVENGRPLALPVGRYLQWRAEMETRDPWRPPGVSHLVFGMTFGPGSTGPASAARSNWLAFLLIALAAAFVAFVLIGRRSLWERKKR